MIRAGRHCAGLTLIELVVVMVVMAILATVAVEMIEPKVDQARFESTRRTIENVTQAIVSERKNADGTYTHTGFLADLGRLPRPTVSGSVLTLGELWLRPDTVAPFAVRPADRATGGVPTDREDPEVLVACGWNGPYLQLAIHSQSLVDGWGTELVSGGLTYSHLRTRDAAGNESAVQDVNDPIYGVRSLGQDNAVGGTAPYDIDLPTELSINTGRIAGVVQGSVSIDGSPPVDQQVIVQLYGPDPETGLIRVDRQLLSGGAATYTFDDADAQYNVKVGTHAIRAYLDADANGQPDPGMDSQIFYFDIRPGINVISDLNIRSSVQTGNP
ncbi:MAG: prepilin-type N-terminal cleavage/methylation domain-containing protein [Pirellulales bacterium]|nr:prepilin-type N-terminal cleavage/methylation domain-containing protein [Pirellulales bacterium]